MPTQHLEPCPICGKQPQWSRYHDRDLAQLSCIGADHSVSGAWGVEEEAIRTWNRRASPWQPIETAPKDGTEVLLAHDGVSTSGNYVNGRWGINPSKGRGGYPGWIEVHPTHWMLLPQDPEADHA